VLLGFERRQKKKRRYQRALIQSEVAQDNLYEALTHSELARQEVSAHLEAIKEKERQLNILNAISSILSQSLEPDQILENAADKIGEVMGVGAILIFLLNEGTQELVLKTYREVSPEFARGVDRIKVGEGFNGRVAESGEPLLIEDSSRESRLARMWGGRG